MGHKYDLILNQIKKASELIATLLTGRKVQHSKAAEINQNLSELTGFEVEFFARESNAALLPNVLTLADDDNKKAVIALLLLLKNEALYKEQCIKVLLQLDETRLHLAVRELVDQALR